MRIGIRSEGRLCFHTGGMGGVPASVQRKGHVYLRRLAALLQ